MRCSLKCDALKCDAYMHAYMHVVCMLYIYIYISSSPSSPPSTPNPLPPSSPPAPPQEASRGFEPRSLDSESRVLTVTPRGLLIYIYVLKTFFIVLHVCLAVGLWVCLFFFGSLHVWLGGDVVGCSLSHILRRFKRLGPLNLLENTIVLRIALRAAGAVGFQERGPLAADHGRTRTCNPTQVLRRRPARVFGKNVPHPWTAGASARSVDISLQGGR